MGHFSALKHQFYFMKEDMSAYDKVVCEHFVHFRDKRR